MVAKVYLIFGWSVTGNIFPCGVRLPVVDFRIFVEPFSFFTLKGPLDKRPPNWPNDDFLMFSGQNKLKTYKNVCTHAMEKNKKANYCNNNCDKKTLDKWTTACSLITIIKEFMTHLLWLQQFMRTHKSTYAHASPSHTHTFTQAEFHHDNVHIIT